MGLICMILLSLLILFTLDWSVNSSGLEENHQDIKRKDVWVPVKNKETEFNDEYRSGVWNESVFDPSFPSGFSQVYAIPIERMRMSVIAGVYFQMYSKDISTSTILDVGCGSGLMANYLMPGQVSRYTGIDISSLAIERAKQRHPQATFINTNLENFEPPNNAKYSMIVFSEVIYYVNHIQILRKYSKFLGDHGVIVLSIWYNEYRQRAKETYQGIIADIQEARFLKLIENVKLLGKAIYVDKGQQYTQPNVETVLQDRVFGILVYRLRSDQGKSHKKSHNPNQIRNH